MNYAIKIRASARKDLLELQKADRDRIVTVIDSLSEQPHQGTLLKGRFHGLRRVRVGRFRIIFEVDDQAITVLIVRVGHRREIYR